MASQGQREAVFPTRMTLGTTKTRLKGAQNGHSLLKRKADALSKRFRLITGKIQDAKRQMGKVLQQAAFSMVEVGYATGDVGYAVRENVKHATFKVRARQDNVSGVFLPSFTPAIVSQETAEEQVLDDMEGHLVGKSAAPAELALTGLSRGGQQVQRARDTYTKALYTLVELASLQTAFVILDEVIRLTNRRVNAIEYVIIPRLENTINVRPFLLTSTLFPNWMRWTVRNSSVSRKSRARRSVQRKLQTMNAAHRQCNVARRQLQMGLLLPKTVAVAICSTQRRTRT